MYPPLIFDNYWHQQREWDLYKEARARALLWRMRTGKTKAMVDLACHLWVQGKIDAVVIVAPNGVHLNWSRREIPRHRWLRVPCRQLAWDSAIVKRRYFKELLSSFMEMSGDFTLPWLCLNSEGLLADSNDADGDSLDMFQLLKKYFRGKRVLLIIDECDDFGRPGSKRTKRMRAVAKYATFVRILTGTVVADSPLAAYSQFQLLEKGALGFDTYEDFEAHFASYGTARTRAGRQYPIFEGYMNLDELKNAIAEWSSVVLRSDVPGLSEIIPGVRTFRMTARQEDAYGKMLEGFIDDPDKPTDIDPEWDDVEEPFVGGAKLVKLQQIASGWVKTRDGRIIDLAGKNDPRIKAMIEQAEQEKGKCVIWCRFKEDIRRVSEALSKRKGHKVVEYHGGVTSRAKERNLEAFQDPDSGVTDLVGQPQSLGRGRDLSTANQMINYSHVFSNKLREQASERATAVGKEPVALTDLSASGTVDEYALETLATKQSISEDVAGRGLAEVLATVNAKWLSERTS